MIRKPSGVQQDDRLHSAVGSVIRTGTKVRSAGRTAQRAGRSIILYYFFGMMGFGLLMSGTPIWFKLIIGAFGYGAFKVLRGRRTRDPTND